VHKKQGLVEFHTLHKKGCDGDSHRRDKIAEKKVLGQVYLSF
jgi:hypothetical protein